MNQPPHTPSDRARALLATSLAALLIVTTAYGQTTSSDTVVLSPFEVTGERDFGYLKTNSSTATRIGMEIQKIPLSVSVISEDFIKDTGMQDISDVLRYQASAAGDNMMGVLQPATSFTPSGNIALRGFPINARLRNGLLRYNNYSLDNVERVEVVKGPAAIFYGLAFPGGVINYITKKPVFSKIPSTITYNYGGEGSTIGSQRVAIDSNNAFSNKAAMRVVGSYDNQLGYERASYQKGYSITPTIKLVPFDDSRLTITVEGELVRRRRNINDQSWRYDPQWFADYANPPQELMQAAGVWNAANPAASIAAYRTRIVGSPNNWIADVRKAKNDPRIPLWTFLERGAYYLNSAGQLIHDEKFNYYGPGVFSDEENSSLNVVVDASPVEFLDLRYSFINEQNRYTETKATTAVRADRLFNAESGILRRDYIMDAETHQIDLVLKADVLKMKNKLLFGGLARDTSSAYTGTQPLANVFPNYGYIPGAYDKPDEGYVSPIPPAFRQPVAGWGIGQQYVRDRAGKIITPYQVFREWDPGIQIYPDIGRITEVSRGLVDRYKPYRREWYINYQGQALDDRLTVLLGYRKEKQTDPGQRVASNPPWYQVDTNPMEIPPAQWGMYGLSVPYSVPSSYTGVSKMAGVSFDAAKDVTVYASYSQSYLPNTVPTLSGGFDPNIIRQRAIDLGLNPDTELARIRSQGGFEKPVNEKGENKEIGVKLNLNDSKIVATISVYQLDRANRMLDDLDQQTNEQLNYLPPGKAQSGTYNRVVRWYSNAAISRTEGLEVETIWTPIRNYQAYVSASYMWKAKVLSDSTVPASHIMHDEYFSQRIPQAPKYRLSILQKYTFSDGPARGLALGLGMRYSSELNIATNSPDWTPSKGGLTAGDYVVFDGSVSYPFEAFGYKLTGSLRGTNLTDKLYTEGWYNLAPPRAWWLSVDMRF